MAGIWVFYGFLDIRNNIWHDFFEPKKAKWEIVEWKSIVLHLRIESEDIQSNVIKNNDSI